MSSRETAKRCRILLGTETGWLADVIRSIGDSSDDFERMLAVLRFLFSKDLKFVRARLGKTYNSALGGCFCIDSF